MRKLLSFVLVALFVTSCQTSLESDSELNKLVEDYNLTIVDKTTFGDNYVSFSSAEEARNFLKSVSKPKISAQGVLKSKINQLSNKREAWDDVPPPDPAPKIVELEIWFGWAGYEVIFIYEDGAVTEFASDIVGVSPGVSWEQKAASGYRDSKGIVHFEVLGNQKYSIIVDGVGTFYTQQVSLNGTWNPKTGSYDLNVENR